MNKMNSRFIVVLIVVSCIGIYILSLNAIQTNTIGEQEEQLNKLTEDKLRLEKSNDFLKEQLDTFKVRVDQYEQLEEIGKNGLSELVIGNLNSINALLSENISFNPTASNRLSWFEDRYSLRYLEDTDNRYAVVSEKEGLLEVYTRMNVNYFDWFVHYHQKGEFESLTLYDYHGMVYFDYLKLDNQWYCRAEYVSRAFDVNRERSEWELVSEESSAMELSYVIENIRVILENEMNITAMDLLKEVQTGLENGTLKSQDNELKYIDQTVLNFGNYMYLFEILDIRKNEEEIRISILIRAGCDPRGGGQLSNQMLNWSRPQTILIKDGIIHVIDEPIDVEDSN